MSFSDPLGAATVARLRFCRPGEQVLWAAYREVFYLDIEGLDPFREPRKGVLSRGAQGIGGFMLVEVLLGGGDDSGPDKPPPADLLAFGPAPGCHVHQAMSGIAAPGRRQRRLWVLTPSRLGVLGIRPPHPERPEQPIPEGRSLMRKAAGFGKGLVDTGRDIAKIVTDNRRRYGDNVEGEPVVIPDWAPLLEFGRDRIGGVAVTERRRKRGSVPCARISLTDGSGLDFLLPAGDPALPGHVAALMGVAR